MLSVLFKTKKATADLKKSIDQTVRSIAKDFFTEVKRLTPVRSGLAKRSWKLKRKSRSQYAVDNPQPYIDRLDTGYSNQAPRGMTRPALREVKDKYRNRRIK